VKLEHEESPRITRQRRFVEEEIAIDNIPESVYAIIREKPIISGGPGERSRVFAEILLDHEITLETVTACCSAGVKLLSEKNGQWYVDHAMHLLSVRMYFRLYRYLLPWWDVNALLSLRALLRFSADILFSLLLVRWFNFNLAFVGFWLMYPLFSETAGVVIKWTMVDGIILLGLYVLSRILYRKGED